MLPRGGIVHWAPRIGAHDVRTGRYSGTGPDGWAQAEPQPQEDPGSQADVAADDSTFAEIAKVLGASRATVYPHFDDAAAKPVDSA